MTRHAIGSTGWLTEERAKAAQDWLRRSGGHRCATCAQPVWRFPTSADPDLLRTWAEDADGTWWLHPITGIMHPWDPDDQGDFWRFRPHSCVFGCNPDETDQ